MDFETHKDDYPQSVGTHKGSDGAVVLFDAEANFSVYIKIGVVCYNVTQETNGLVTASTRDTLTVTDVTWDKDDEYEIYVTAEKDSHISSFAIDKIYGRKLRA
jgi:hypothetical protein